MKPSSPLDARLFLKGDDDAAGMPTESQQTIALTEAALLALRRALTKSEGADQPYTDQQIHVLVDPTQSDPLSVHPQTKDLSRVPLKIDIFEPEKRPYLLCLKNSVADERALNATLTIAMEESQGLHDTEDGQVRSICAWLINHEQHDKRQALSTKMLAATFARLSWVRPPIPRMAQTVFRFWDPRLTPRLPDILGSETWLRCQQTIRTTVWLAVHEDGLLKAIGPSPAMPGEVIPMNCLRIDSAQWKSLTGLGWCNRLKRVIGQWDMLAPVENVSIERAVHRALDNGLKEDADILRFAHCAFTVHPRFDEHPEVRKLLNEQQEHPAGHFATVSQQWSEEFTQVLRSGSWMRDANVSTSSTSS